MRIETDRLIITEFTMDMAEAVHLNSLDDDNRKYVPDEVFETTEDAADTISYLMECYETGDGPLVYPVLLKDGKNIGYVQAVPIDDLSYEVGYHIAKVHTGKGYAAEAVQAFLPVIMEELGIDVILGTCVRANRASAKVMEKCGFKLIFEGMGDYQGEKKDILKYIYRR